jgi:hypothetical protein
VVKAFGVLVWRRTPEAVFVSTRILYPCITKRNSIFCTSLSLVISLEVG